MAEKKTDLATIRSLTDQPCFNCRTTEKTAHVSLGDGTFRGVLCMDCLHEKVKPAAPQVARQKSA